MRALFRSALVRILRTLPAPPLTDAERIAQIEAECLTLSEQIWRSMQSRHTS